ncbi:MAG: PilZ domain-containing protein [Calditrichaeota bacterium]|nr:MAG: PilZ domain-containing protein [Calditrichota bacterium]
MSIITSQQLNKYYTSYKSVDVTFTKELINTTGLDGRQTFFKFKQGQKPCIIYSTSMTGAKIIASFDDNLFNTLRNENNVMSLRFAFQSKESSDPILFFIQGRITGFSPINKSKPDLFFATIDYTNRPPDDLIQIIGSIVDAATNSKARAEERILINEENNRKLTFNLKTTVLLVDNLPRKCLLRDVSFSGAKLILMGNAKFIVNKPVVLRIEYDNGRKIFNLPGMCLRHEEVEGRKDLAALGLKFADQGIPIEYRLLINEFFKQRKTPKVEKMEKDN